MTCPASFDGLMGSPDLRVWEPGEWALCETLSYLSKAGKLYQIPRAFISDLASIPKPLRAVYDTDDEIRIPALFHDFNYCSQLDREEADKLFLEMMEQAGVGWAKRKSVYAGVRSGGWYRYNQCKGGPKAEDFAWPMIPYQARSSLEARWPSVLSM